MLRVTPLPTGRVRIHASQVQPVVERMRELLVKMPQSAVLQFELGQALATIGNLTDGRKAFESAAALNSKYTPPRLALGEMDARDKRFDAARQQLAGRLDVVRAASGMRTIAWIRTGESGTEVAARARALGLEVAVVSDFTIVHAHPSALILGFAGCASAELKRGVDVLSGALLL